MTPALHAYISRLAQGWRGKSVVELGAAVADGQDAIAPYRVIRRSGARYAGVDMVVQDHIAYPCDITIMAGPVVQAIHEADIVLCLETLEHVPEFWLVLDALRVMRSGSELVLSVPTFGFPYHPHPVDCYRFHEDALQGMTRGYKTLDVTRLPDTAGNETLVWRGVRGEQQRNQ